MSIWITDDVKKAVETIPQVSVIRIDSGEDITTKSLTLAVSGSSHHVYVRGFNTDTHNRLLADDHVNVEMAEVSTGFSDGDMPNDPVYVVIHAKVMSAMMILGHKVVKSMEPYF